MNARQILIVFNKVALFKQLVSHRFLLYHLLVQIIVRIMEFASIDLIVLRLQKITKHIRMLSVLLLLLVPLIVPITIRVLSVLVSLATLERTVEKVVYQHLLQGLQVVLWLP